MTDDRKAGITLIAGSVGGVVTMAIHPTGAGPFYMMGLAHSLALVSVLLLFLGGCGLWRRLADADRISFTALVTFGFACVAVMIAGGVSGFTLPGMLRDMGRDVPEAAHQWRMMIDSVFQINQAFARIYSVGTSIAMILWSVSVLRNGGLSRSVAIYGCIVAPLVIVAIAIGHLRLDVHGMTVVMVSQVIWFVVAGAQMLRHPATTHEDAA